MAKKVCISGYYGFDNFGDEMILKILVDNLKSYVRNTDITVFSVNPQKTSENLNVNSLRTFNIFDIVSSILKCDCLISGGGSLLQTSTSVKSLFYYLFIIALAVIFQKKVIIFAQGIGPIKGFFLKHFTMFLLKKAVYITVRDNNSLSLLSSYGIEGKKCDDPVWNVSTQKIIHLNKIGIQLRDFPLITDNFILNLAQNVNKYYSDKEIVILSLQNTLDMEICEKLKSVLRAINKDLYVSVIENTGLNKVIDDICSVEALIAMRYHACLIGIKAGIKVLPINYDIKVETLANEFGLNCINSANDIDEKFENFVNNEIFYNNSEKKFDFGEIGRIINE